MNEKMNVMAGLVFAVLLVGAVGATVVMFMAEAEAATFCYGSSGSGFQCYSSGGDCNKAKRSDPNAWTRCVRSP